MNYQVLACDYDGTIADDGTVNAETRRALERCRASGRRLILVTGRELDELKQAFPQLSIFDYVVVENGAALYQPTTGVERRLSDPPSERFVHALQQRGVSPLSVGRSIVATVQPHETAVLEAIRDLGLELHVIFNKGAVMILPSGVNKATGLKTALKELNVPLETVVAVGDGENDHSLLSAAGYGVAVRNAVPLLQKEADTVTESPASRGVIELIDRLITDDLASWPKRSRPPAPVTSVPLANAPGERPA